MHLLPVLIIRALTFAAIGALIAPFEAMKPALAPRWVACSVEVREFRSDPDAEPSPRLLRSFRSRMVADGLVDDVPGRTSYGDV